MEINSVCVGPLEHIQIVITNDVLLKHNVRLTQPKVTYIVIIHSLVSLFAFLCILFKNRSRKLNTHLENAIQEAMADLDKKSEKHLVKQDHGDDGEDDTPISDTPRRSKKQDRQRNKLYKKSSKDSTRLRNSR